MENNYKYTEPLKGYRITVSAERKLKNSIVSIQLEGYKIHPRGPDDWKYEIVGDRKEEGTLGEHLVRSCIVPKRLTKSEILNKLEVDIDILSGTHKCNKFFQKEK